ncbi:uncharacterized protein KY384_007984 [Bacidia gigantensis]|uniref:uncharacterized protein n=1 Tax=Bacidia gigantensis TaxID=2732470 RepID=UPI001D0369A2|nr:uncharacterized protein KY384_007984 [Bacidia gigantensis]KAG8527240.1 hypothetical protein KY384_007984 [Bacidia gigantensis]
MQPTFSAVFLVALYLLLHSSEAYVPRNTNSSEFGFRPDNARFPLPPDYRQDTTDNDHYHVYNYGRPIPYEELLLAITSAQTWMFEQLVEDVLNQKPALDEPIDVLPIKREGYAYVNRGVEFHLSPAIIRMDYQEFKVLMTGFAKLAAQFQIQEFMFAFYDYDVEQHKEDPEDLIATGYLRIVGATGGAIVA